jgi:hypothetical protein
MFTEDHAVEHTAEPAAEEHAVEIVSEEPAAEPTVDEHAAEPAVEEPVVEPAAEPVVEEPVAEEPATEPAVTEPLLGGCLFVAEEFPKQLKGVQRELFVRILSGCSSEYLQLRGEVVIDYYHTNTFVWTKQTEAGVYEVRGTIYEDGCPIGYAVVNVYTLADKTICTRVFTSLSEHDAQSLGHERKSFPFAALVYLAQQASDGTVVTRVETWRENSRLDCTPSAELQQTACENQLSFAKETLHAFAGTPSTCMTARARIPLSHHCTHTHTHTHTHTPPSYLCIPCDRGQYPLSSISCSL